MKMVWLLTDATHPYLWFVLLFWRSVSGLGGWGFFGWLLGLGQRVFVGLQLVLAFEITLLVQELAVSSAEKMKKIFKINFIVNISELVVVIIKQFIFGPLFATLFHPRGNHKG